jgi:hypothetical protein
MKRKREQPYKYLAMISQVGVSVIVPIGMMILFGKMLDYFFHTGNLVVIIFAVVGMLAGLRNLYVIPLRMSEQAQKKAAENKTEEEKADEKKRAQEYRDQIKKENEDDENDADF